MLSGRKEVEAIEYKGKEIDLSLNEWETYWCRVCDEELEPRRGFPRYMFCRQYNKKFRNKKQPRLS